MAKSDKSLPGASNRTLQALVLHQHQKNLQKAHQELEVAQRELDRIQKEAEEIKRKKQLDDKLHEETRKELENFKAQYDADYILEQKAVKRETMKRARLAKSDAKKRATKLAKEKSKKPASKGSSARAQTRQSAKKRAR